MFLVDLRCFFSRFALFVRLEFCVSVRQVLEFCPSAFAVLEQFAMLVDNGNDPLDLLLHWILQSRLYWKMSPHILNVSVVGTFAELSSSTLCSSGYISWSRSFANEAFLQFVYPKNTCCIFRF